MRKHNSKNKIAIVHPSLTMGGAGAVAVWIIEALKKEYDLTLITTDSVNIKKLNIFFGTDLSQNDFKIIKISHFFLRYIINGFLFKAHLAQRYYKKHKHEYDLVISTRCEMDFGEIGVQYIHFPVLIDEPIRKLGQLDNRNLIRKSGFFREIYKNICNRLSDFSEDNMKRNITLVNSKWTGRVVKEVYDIDCQTVYPPVIDDFPDVPFENREFGFVSIGAIVPLKRVETMIKIIERVRALGFNIHFHLIGSTSTNNREFLDRINQLQKKFSKWLFIEEGLTRKDLVKLVACHKFGIHGMPYEHFGIVVAEMVNAGCIPFVPNNGGQVEIVNDSRLTYSTVDDAVIKISNALNNETIQKSLREQLSKNRGKFSIRRFKKEILDIVKDSLNIIRKF